MFPAILAATATGAGAGALFGGAKGALVGGLLGFGTSAMMGVGKGGSPQLMTAQLSPEGREMVYGNRYFTGNTSIEKMGGLVGSVRDQWEQAKQGAKPDKIAPQLSALTSKENARYDASKTAYNALQSTISNRGYLDRGYAAQGGFMGKLALQDASERMEGLFNPTSLLNQYRREELVNAMGKIQNIQNMENRVAITNFQGQLTKALSDQLQSAQRGAMIGGALQFAGNFALNQAYMTRLGMIS